MWNYVPQTLSRTLNTPSKNSKLKPPKGGHPSPEAQGQDFVIPYLDRPWDVKGLTIDRITQYEDDFFLLNVENKLTQLIFQGPPRFNVLDINDDSLEDTAAWVRQMCRDLDIYSKIKNSFHAIARYGAYVHSDGFARDKNGRIIFSEIRELPPSTFRYLGYSDKKIATYGYILKGIMRTIDQQAQQESNEYWQIQFGTEPVKIENCSHFRSPIYSQYIDGVPLLTPVYKILPKLNWTVDGLIQANNKANMFMLKVNKYGKMADALTNVWDYTNTILKSASKNHSFALPPEVEPVQFQNQDYKIHLETVNMFVKWVISLYSPADVISKGEGTLIGGSTNYEAQLFKAFAWSFQSYLADEWSRILTPILEYNGYPKGTRIEVSLPPLQFENEQLDFQKAQLILQAASQKRYLGSRNEAREFMHLDNGSDEFFQKCAEEWEQFTVQMDTDAQPEIDDHNETDGIIGNEIPPEEQKLNPDKERIKNEKQQDSKRGSNERKSTNNSSSKRKSSK